jgi:hypothetical protein
VKEHASIVPFDEGELDLNLLFVLQVREDLFSSG